MKRIEAKFKELNGQTALVGYICAGDPGYELSLGVLNALPSCGVDIIEVGIPFLDPAGDGPIIEEASKRAINAGMSFEGVLDMVEEFRATDNSTPIVLMGYYNSFLRYGLKDVFLDAKDAGADGVLIVDLPLEERDEIKRFVDEAEIDLVNLIAPLSDKERVAKIAKDASGFLYLISMLGITGTKEALVADNVANLEKIRNVCDLKTVIGFGIKSPEKAKEFASIGVDGVVIGSEIVKKIYDSVQSGLDDDEVIEIVKNRVKEFSLAIKS